MVVADSDLDQIWADLLGRHPLLERRPSFAFDPRFYRRTYPDVAVSGLTPLEHYEQRGRRDGRFPNRYKQLRAEQPGIDAALREITTEPRILAAMDAAEPAAFELAFELIRLGEPWDASMSHFSADHYRSAYVDVVNSGLDPLTHYVVFGVLEQRRTLADVRRAQYAGSRPYDPGLPTCLLTSHELSRTGAPMVVLQMAREAAATHNVVVASVQPGPLLDAMRETSCAVVVTATPHADFAYFEGPVFDTIELAVCNSVESFPFIPMLVARGIPFASYVHEYATYTFPAYKTVQTALFSDLLVFSSEHVRDTWRPALDDAEVEIARDVVVLPQRRPVVGAVDQARTAAARKRLAGMLGRDLTGKRIVCGAGFTDWRKGTDIFVMTAQIARHRDPDTIFVWVGDGLDPEDTRFGTWMSYHLDQAGADLPEGNLHFLPAGEHYADVLVAADSMLLASRLDPLPNVVFDALEAGCRVVFFEGATGFNDPVYLDTGHLHRVEYANPDAAASLLLSLPAKSREEHAEEQAEEPLGAATPSPHRLFDALTSALTGRLAAQRRFVIGPTPLDVPVLFSGRRRDRDLRTREREKLVGLGRRYLWRDADDARASLSASTSWVHRSCDVVEYAETDGTDLPDFSMHLHAFHVEPLAGDIGEHPLYRQARRIVVTTDTEPKRARVEAIMAGLGLRAEVLVVPNRGRDVLPFLDLFRSGLADPEEIWCHLHQKQSAADGDTWRRFLHAILVGADGISTAVTTMRDESVGLVAALDPHYGQWNASRRLLPLVEGRFAQPLPANPMVYPIGNMFWVRGRVVEAMNDLFGPDHAWTNEPLPYDGSEFHLIERLWPAVAAGCGLRSAFISKSDQPRRN